MSTAGQAIGGAIGAVVGFFVGGHPARCTARKSVSVSVATSIRQRAAPRRPAPLDLSVQTSTYGAVIPRVYGTIALNGKCFGWKTTPSGGGVDKNNKAGGKGRRQIDHHDLPAITRPSQSAFARADFRNPPNLGRLQADLRCRQRRRRRNGHGQQPGRAGYDDLSTGSESQMPDTRMQATLGAANTRRVYRGLAYIVFHDFALANYGNSPMGAPIVPRS